MQDNNWKKDFVDKINKLYLEEINIKEALDFKRKFIPKSLFRYRIYSKRELENLELGKIWLSSPDNFNDPYDTLPMSDKFCFYQNIRKTDFFLAMLKKECNKNKINQNEKDKIYNLVDNLTIEIYNKIFNSLYSLRQTFKIACFSETVDNTLMWSHYANYHQGFCIEYDFSQNDFLMTLLHPVIYSENIFDISEYIKTAIDNYDALKNNLHHNNLYIHLTALYKSIHWNYENEWRLIIQDKNIKNIDSPKIKAIYFGTKMPEQEKTTLIDFAKRHDVEIYDMRLKGNEFKLVHQKREF